MAVKVTLKDYEGNEVTIAVSCNYSPDVIDDLNARAQASYSAMLAQQDAVWDEEEIDVTKVESIETVED